MDKGFKKYFNSTTLNGRANVAKATYATIALVYLYSRMRRGKGSKTKQANNDLPAASDDLKQCRPDSDGSECPVCREHAESEGGTGTTVTPPPSDDGEKDECNGPIQLTPPPPPLPLPPSSSLHQDAPPQSAPSIERHPRKRACPCDPHLHNEPEHHDGSGSGSANDYGRHNENTTHGGGIGHGHGHGHNDPNVSGHGGPGYYEHFEKKSNCSPGVKQQLPTDPNATTPNMHDAVYRVIRGAFDALIDGIGGGNGNGSTSTSTANNGNGNTRTRRKGDKSHVSVDDEMDDIPEYYYDD